MHVEVFIVPADWQFIRALQPLAVTHSRAFHPYSPTAALLSDTALKQTQCVLQFACGVRPTERDGSGEK